MKKKKLVYILSLILASQTALADDHKPCDKDDAKCQKKSSIKVSNELPSVSVTANRMNTDIAKYSGQISVLTGSGLQGSENIIENMATIPGMETGDDWGRSIGSQFKIRGFGYQSENRVIIEQDGVKRSPSLFSNHISTFRVDPGLLKRVEVVKGASSILHGSGAIGGIVSMRTKNAKDFINDGNNIGFTLGGRRESNNLSSGHLAFAIAPEKIPVDFLVYAKRSKLGNIQLADGGTVDKKGKRTDKTFNDEKINVSYIKGGVDITPDMRLSLSAYKYDEKLNTVWQTLWHNDDITEDPVRGKLKQSDYVLDYRFAPSDNPWIDLSAKAYKSDASYHRINQGKDRKGKPFIVDYTNKDKRWGLGIKNQSVFDTGFIDHHLVAGIDYENRQEDAIHSVDGKYSDFGTFPNYYKDLGIYVQDTMGIGIVDLTLGGRYDSFKRGVNKPGQKDFSGSHFSPKIGAAVEVFNGINLLAGYAETFRGPTPNETGASGSLNPHYYYLPNTELKPETAKEYELGFSIDKENILAKDDHLFFKATYFKGKIEDMINLKGLKEKGKTPDHDKYKNQIYAQYQNVSDARRKGVELEAQYHLGGWNFGVGYDYLKLYDAKNGKRLASFANKLSLQAGYLYEPWGLNVGLQATRWFKAKRDKLTFERWGETYKYINRPFTIVNLKTSWTPKRTGVSFFDKGFQLKFGVNNLFDKQFIHPSNTEDTASVGKGRNVYLEFEKTF